MPLKDRSGARRWGCTAQARLGYRQFRWPAPSRRDWRVPRFAHIPPLEIVGGGRPLRRAISREHEGARATGGRITSGDHVGPNCEQRREVGVDSDGGIAAERAGGGAAGGELGDGEDVLAPRADGGVERGAADVDAVGGDRNGAGGVGDARTRSTVATPSKSKE